MLIECFAILALILAIFFIYMRMKSTRHALTILPLSGVPLAHVLSQLLFARLAGVLPIDAAGIVTIVDIASLVVSTLFCGALSVAYEKKSRMTYLVIVGLFNVILTCILLVNLKTP